MNNTKIVNKTGRVQDTKVYVDGVELKGIRSIVIDPIVAGRDLITATLNVSIAELDVVADVSN